jgi:proline dehydrogenase
VNNAEKLLNVSSKVLGTTFTNAVMKHTFFKHFCAGEYSADMKPVIDRLQENNIGPILDYAAESDSDGSSASGDFEGLTTQPPFNQPARIYDYKSEKQCDHHVEIFKNCIRSVRDVSPHGFAALKVTALGNPVLLERMSTIIVEVKKFFATMDENKTGFISREDFLRCYDRHFHREDPVALDEILDLLDPNNEEMIDYISFAKMLTPYTLSSFTLKCKEVGPLAQVTPSDDEIALMAKISERLCSLAEEAASCGTKLLIDAEHQKYQPAIDSLVLELQQQFNAKDVTDRPVIFNTYQCYLKDMPERMVTDLKRSERFSFHFAAKLVRGAYMVHERARAKELKIPSPIHDTIEHTHRCYDDSVKILLEYRKKNGPGLELMIASHNKKSIEKTVQLMNEMELTSTDSTVHFAQLFGMADNLTFPLGLHGYNAFKYLPYGKVQEVLPYLLRRAQENGDMLGNAGSEVDLLKQELKKRVAFA